MLLFICVTFGLLLLKAVVSEKPESLILRLLVPLINMPKTNSEVIKAGFKGWKNTFKRDDSEPDMVQRKFRLI
ncbi:MAG: hypothetical protein JRJ65_10505 [Deltaproteobacteria bacterium]|nr:hypothetical protein [Deltaproteobacteria bacterium]